MTELLTVSQLAYYIPRQWLDRIYKIGPDGKLKPKLDSDGQPVLNPYTGYPEYETLEEGTRFYAEFMNHIEQGIANAHKALSIIDKEMKKMQALMELDGRAPNNNGTFADIFDDGDTISNFERLTAKTDVTVAVEVGEMVISVADASLFTPMTYVTIYDADSYEHVRVTAVDVEAQTITVDAVVNAYSKGAKIARSTASVDTVNQSMDVAPFVTYNVELVEVV